MAAEKPNRKVHLETGVASLSNLRSEGLSTLADEIAGKNKQTTNKPTSELFDRAQASLGNTKRLSSEEASDENVNAILSEVESLLDAMEKDIEGDTGRKTMCQRTVKSLNRLNEIYYTEWSESEKELIGKRLAKQNAAYIFTRYCRLLDNSKKQQQQNISSAHILRSVMFNYSNASIRFAEELAKMGIVQIVMDDLIVFKDDYKRDKETTFLVISGINILLNCAKSPNNAKYFKDKKVMDTIAQFSKMEAKLMKVFALFVLAYVALDKTNKYLITTDTAIIEDIMQAAKLSSKQNPPDEMSTMELVEGLKDLASNENYSTIMVEKGVVQLLETIFLDGSKGEKESAGGLVLVLSSNPKNKGKLSNSKGIMKGLEALAEKSILEDAKLALRDLKSKSSSSLSQEKKTSRDESKLDEKPEVDGGYIMISYSHEHKELVEMVNNSLVKLGYKVWIDVEQMQGNMFMASAKAVENAEVVLMCLSQSYEHSTFCQKEAEHACKKNTEIIPLILEAGYQPSEKFDFIVGANFYYDFSSEDQFDKMMVRLTKQLGDKGTTNTTLNQDGGH